MKIIINEIKKRIGDNLYAIVPCGSVGTEDYREHWSDIDLIIIVHKVSFAVKQDVARCIKLLEYQLNRHIGINLVSKREILRSKKPEYFLPGKTLQALYENKLRRIPPLYIQEKKEVLPVPGKQLIKRYSLLNIGMFVIRNRRTLSEQVPTTRKDYQRMTTREIRACFIITKLALQYFTTNTYSTKRRILTAAKRQLPNFDFARLDDMLGFVSTIKKIKNPKVYRLMLEKADSYLEDFIVYVQKNIS